MNFVQVIPKIGKARASSTMLLDPMTHLAIEANMHTRLSRRAQRLTSSAIREILKVTSQPEVISFAGGVPAPETFPVERLRAAAEAIFTKDSTQALQYSLTEGYLPLRQWAAEKHQVDVEQVLITTGSQQGLDLLAKALIDPGSRVLVESPSYLGAVQAFSLFDPEFCELPCDDIGIRPGDVRPDDLRGARMAYLMPNFQNPTGRVMPLECRYRLCELLRDSEVLIVEDDPYADLIFDGQPLPSLRSIYPEGVAYLGSFSKILAPGLRIGYLVAPRWLTAKATQLKQAADLHTSSFDQRLAHHVLASGAFPELVAATRNLYAARCEAMLEALRIYMPEEIRWNTPSGGMFLWLTLPLSMDSQALLLHSIDESLDTRVAFVPGAPFYAVNPSRHCLRLSFATVDVDHIDRGIRQLAENIRQLCPRQG